MRAGASVWLILSIIILLFVPVTVFGQNIIGTGKNDILRGTQGSDSIVGLAGNDVLEGLEGDDSLQGDSGNDNLRGGPGNDNLRGGPGKDTFSCGPGNDVIEDYSSEDRVASDCEAGGPIHGDSTGTIIVRKRVINDNGNSKSASDFTINVVGENPSETSFKGSESGTKISLSAGSYSIMEQRHDGYELSLSKDCSGKIKSGETRNCSVTNDDIAQTGKLLVKKHVINNNEGDKQASDFTIGVTGNQPNPASFIGNEAGTEVKLKTGSYSVTESGPAGYESSMTTGCNGNINPGQTETCVITNDDIPPPSDTSSPVITSPTATPGTLGPGQSKITLGVHVTDNVGVTLVYIGVYEKGKTDATIDGAFYSLGLIQGDNKNGQYVGEYTFADSVPDGEYDVRYFAKDAAQNQAIGGPVTVTLDRIPPPDPEPPVITSPTATPGTLGPGQSKITLGVHVTDMACDMKTVPLPDEAIDIAVFSLSLMGRNWSD